MRSLKPGTPCEYVYRDDKYGLRIWSFTYEGGPIVVLHPVINCIFAGSHTLRKEYFVPKKPKEFGNDKAYFYPVGKARKAKGWVLK